MTNKQNIKVGDLVAIRGDYRINNNGKCAYAPDQLVEGKYIRHASHGGIWVGVVEKVNIESGRALVGSGWRPIDVYEVLTTKGEGL